MAVGQEKYRVIFIAPTCFFYQAPIFRELAAHPRIDLTVLFCSNEALRGSDVHSKFNTVGEWGDEGKTLDGYKHKFVRNFSPWPSYLRWPFGLINIGLWREVQKSKPHSVTLMSWVNVTDFIVMGSCLVFRHPIFFMTDANVKAEDGKLTFLSWIKHLILGGIVFRFARGFLCSGKANQQFYQHYGVSNDKLVPFAFSWESKDFLEESAILSPQRTQLRAELGFRPDSRILLYCGRLSPEKNPGEALRAYQQVKSPNKTLIFVGDGALRASLENYVRENDIESVHFVGFQNRKYVGKYYAIADALVLPSLKEATGAVLTEAMCFGLPVIASDQVGFGIDLIEHGTNGFIYPVGEVETLAGHMTQILEASDEERASSAAHSLERIAKWSSLDLAESILKHLDSIYKDKSRAHEQNVS